MRRCMERLGKGPRSIDTNTRGLAAQMSPSGHAVAAASTDHMPFAADDVARLKVGDIGADFDDLTHTGEASDGSDEVWSAITQVGSKPDSAAMDQMPTPCGMTALATGPSGRFRIS